MRRIIREVEPPPPSRTTGTGEALPLSQDLDLITLQALEKNRERRYPSAAALQDDIRRFLNHEPILARAPSSTYLFARWLRRHRLLATTTAFTLLALIIGGVTTYREKLEAEKQASEANTMLKMMLVTTVWETDKIDTVGLSKIGPALALAAAKVDSLPLHDDERMRLSDGVGKAYLGLENWPKAIQYISLARDAAIHRRLPFRTIREFSEILAFSLIQGGRSEEALALTEKLVPQFDQELVPDDPSLLYIRQLRAQALASAGRYAESLALYQEIFDRLKHWPGIPRPLDVVGIHIKYPEILRKSGDPAAALTAARENIELAKHGLGEVDTFYADVLVASAHECIEAGELKEADGYVEWAWQLYLDTYGPAHLCTRRYKDELLVLKQKLGLLDEALKVWRDTLSVYQSETGKTSAETLEETEGFTKFLIENHRLSEAAQLTEDAINDLTPITPPTPDSDRWLRKMNGKLAEIKAANP